MTSDEIKRLSHLDLSTNGWLREIAYQMARQNELLLFGCDTQPQEIQAQPKKTGKPAKIN